MHLLLRVLHPLGASADQGRVITSYSIHYTKLYDIHTIGPYLLPQLIHSLKHIAPNMPLAIEENMTANLADMLRDNDIDVAIIALPFDLPGVLTRPLYDEPFT